MRDVSAVFQRVNGIDAIIAARASAAFALGNPASLLASVHGSIPRRASTEAMLSCIPVSSSPIVANRKSSRLVSSCRNRAARVRKLPLVPRTSEINKLELF